MPGLPIIEGVRTDGEFDKKRRATYPGQAHFGGTGPAGKTCRECEHWGWKGDRRETARCHQFHTLTGAWGAAVPHEAKACRHFKPAAKPPRPGDLR